MSKELNEGNIGAKYETPPFFQENYPLFLEFMDTFFEWFYRQTGFTADEITSYLNDPAAWMDASSDASPMQQLINYKIQKSPGRSIKDILEDKFLVRHFEQLQSMDDDALVDSDGRPLFSAVEDENSINAWYKDFGFQKTANKSFQDFGNFVPKGSDRLITAGGYTYCVYIEGIRRRTLDHARWLKLLKRVYAIRGTKKAMELFFWVYFGCPINVYYPKEDIAGLDDNFDLDGTTGLRDDYYYDEHTYVIQVSGDVAEFEGLFNQIYRKQFHPAGFTVFLESTGG